MKYETISLMIPTYRRPDKLKSIIDSAIKTADNPTCLRFVFCVNKTDRLTSDFLDKLVMLQGSRWEVVYEETLQPNLALYFNKMYDETTFKDSIVSELGDDMVFVTPGWDTKILDEMNSHNGMAIVYFNDNYVAQEKCCVNLFTSREMVTATKKPFMCPFFHADMIDMVWTMVGAMTGTLRYQPDFIIQHNHSTKEGSDEWDETFKRLVPVQKAANAQSNQRLAIVYATLCAKNLIDSGFGKWNILN